MDSKSKLFLEGRVLRGRTTRRVIAVSYNLDTAEDGTWPMFSLLEKSGYGRNKHVAEVAELADALDSGSSARKGVGVQVPPSAPISLYSFLQVSQRPSVRPYP